MSLETVEMYLEVKIDQKKYEAILFTDGDEEFWIPRSCIEDMDHIRKKDYTVQVHRWFAEKEGLV